MALLSKPNTMTVNNCFDVIRCIELENKKNCGNDRHKEIIIRVTLRKGADVVDENAISNYS